MGKSPKRGKNLCINAPKYKYTDSSVKYRLSRYKDNNEIAPETKVSGAFLSLKLHVFVVVIYKNSIKIKEVC